MKKVINHIRILSTWEDDNEQLKVAWEVSLAFQLSLTHFKTVLWNDSFIWGVNERRPNNFLSVHSDLVIKDISLILGGMGFTKKQIKTALEEKK